MHRERSRFSLIIICPYFQLLLMCVALGTPSAHAYNLESHPTTADVTTLANKGFDSARTELESALARFYKTGDQKKATSASAAVFVEWLDLWRWCELLSREASTENAALVQRHIYRRPPSAGLLFVAPGQTPPPDAVAIPLHLDIESSKRPDQNFPSLSGFSFEPKPSRRV